MQKWNYATHRYDEYAVPGNWNCVTYSAYMAQPINCAACGKVVLYGDCYTSMEIHASMGMEYSVCPNCYKKEIARKREDDERWLSNPQGGD